MVQLLLDVSSHVIMALANLLLRLSFVFGYSCNTVGGGGVRLAIMYICL